MLLTTKLGTAAALACFAAGLAGSPARAAEREFALVFKVLNFHVDELQ